MVDLVLVALALGDLDRDVELHAGRSSGPAPVRRCWWRHEGRRGRRLVCLHPPRRTTRSADPICAPPGRTPCCPDHEPPAGARGSPRSPSRRLPWAAIAWGARDRSAEVEAAEPLPGSSPVASAGPALPPPDPAAPLPTSAGVDAALAGPLADPALGGDVRVSVLDAATGEPLAARQAQAGATPASTAKLLTAATALIALGPETRLRTGVAPGAAPASTCWWAAATRRSPRRRRPPARTRPAPPWPSWPSAPRPPWRRRGVSQITLRYDDAAVRAAHRRAELAPRLRRERRRRAGDRAVGRPGPGRRPIATRGSRTPRSRRRAGSPRRSPPRAWRSRASRRRWTRRPRRPSRRPSSPAWSRRRCRRLVERMLTDSDNDLAEALAHLSAAATGEPADFAGGARATRDGAGRPRPRRHRALAARRKRAGHRLAGRAAADHRVARPGVTAPGPRCCGPCLAGMAVGGFNGTLADRFDTADTANAAGLVRGKTGHADRHHRAGRLGRHRRRPDAAVRVSRRGGAGGGHRRRPGRARPGRGRAGRVRLPLTDRTVGPMGALVNWDLAGAAGARLVRPGPERGRG